MDLFTAARRYAEAGLCVIPVKPGSKKAAVRWLPYQQRKPTLEALERWFSGDGKANIACVLGPVSGGLCCLDFDRLVDYQRWQSSNPTLAATLPTVHTSRGRHVYFRNPDLRAQTVNGLELKALGSYVMLPPSRHPSGTYYQWLKPLPEHVQQVPALSETDLLASLAAARLIASRSAVVLRKHTSHGDCVPIASALAEALEALDRKNHSGSVGVLHKRDIRVHERDNISGTATTDGRAWDRHGIPNPSRSHRYAMPVGSADVCSLLGPEALADLIQSTLPLAPGNRHKQVFRLARRLKGDSRLAGLPVASFRGLVRLWHNEGIRRGVICTRRFEDSWLDFADGWERIRIPAGVDVMATVLERADSQPLPAAADLYEDPQVRRLVAICWQLQQHANQHGHPGFYLAVRKAAEALDCDAMTACRWLRLLVLDGVLEVLAKGTPGSRQATLYRYIAT